MKTNYRLLIISFIILLVSSGCNTPLKFAVTPINIDHPLSTQKNIVLLLTSDLCNSSHEYKGLIFSFGPALCANSEKIAKQIFPGARIINGELVDNGEKVRLTIKPVLVSKIIQSKRTLPMIVNTLLVIRWEITDSDGELISKKTIRGGGRDDRLFGASSEPRFRKSIQEAIDNLFIKSSQYLSSSEDLRQALN